MMSLSKCFLLSVDVKGHPILIHCRAEKVIYRHQLLIAFRHLFIGEVIKGHPLVVIYEIIYLQDIDGLMVMVNSI